MDYNNKLIIKAHLKSLKKTAKHNLFFFKNPKNHQGSSG